MSLQAQTTVDESLVGVEIRAAQLAGVDRVAPLQGGDQLPSVREVVRQVTINPNTVHRAYRELEHLGLAEGRLGLGTFITTSKDSPDGKYRASSWRDVLQEGVDMARSSGIADDEIIHSVRSLLSSESETRS